MVSLVYGTREKEVCFNAWIPLTRIPKGKTEYILEIWEVQKQRLYGEDACLCQPQSSAGDLRELLLGKLRSKEDHANVSVDV